MTAGPAETTVVSYGSWSTADTGWLLHDAHLIREDADAFRVDLTAIVIGSTEAQLVTRFEAMEAALFAEHQRVTVTINGQTAFDYTATLADVSGSAPAAAQSTTASWELIGDFRASKSRAYRITIEGLKPALQSGKTGKRDQSISLVESPNGIQGLTVEIEFTPDSSGNTARQVSADATNGFDARVAAIFTSLGLTQSQWEAAGKSTTSDEDDRTVKVSEFYRRLPFNQEAAARDSTTMTNVSYSCRVVRKPTAASAVFGGTGRLAELTVTFGAELVYSGTDLDPDNVIRSTVLPYIESTISLRATIAGARILMGHTLRFFDLPVPRVSGSVFYLVPEGTLLSGSAVIREQEFFGDTYVPRLSKTDPYKVHRYTGPGLRVAQLVVATEEVGSYNVELARVATALSGELFRQGFKPVGEAKQSEQVRRSFDDPSGSGVLETSIQTLTRQFRYAPGESGGAGASPTGGSVGSTRTRG